MVEKKDSSLGKSKYANLALSTDILIFSVSKGNAKTCRNLSEKYFSILLIKRNKEPFKDKWCLPGGFVETNETLDMAADRILAKETNLHNIYKEQLYTFGEIERDPRMRVISTSYMALIDKEQLTENLSEDASWFNIHVQEKAEFVEVILENEEEQIKYTLKKELLNQTTNQYKYEIVENKKVGFDHAIIIMTGVSRMKNKVQDTDIIFNMMPEYFTLGELQQIYEVILDKKLLDPAFRRIIADKVEKTDKLVKTGGHRPSVLYKYKK